MTASVIYLQNALCPQKRRMEHIKPCAIKSLAPKWDTPFIALKNGQAVLRKDWDKRIKHGDVLAFVDVQAMPQGGDSGESDPRRIVLMVAVIVAAYYTGGAVGGGAWGAVAQATVTVAGSMLVNRIIPPPKPPTPQQMASLAASSPTYNLQAQGNQARLEAAIPEHFGRHVAYPDFAAMPYVEYAGNEQYLYQLLCIGRGYYEIEAVRIEDTPIANFDEITYEIVQPGGTLALFPSSVLTSVEVSGQTLGPNYLGPFVANASGSSTSLIGIDFIAPRGLYYANDNGTLANMSAAAQVETRKIDDLGAPLGDWVVQTAGIIYGPWTDWTITNTTGVDTDVQQWRYQMFPNGTFAQTRTRTVSTQGEVFSGATTTPQRYSRQYAVPAGRYEVRVKRIDVEITTTRVGHELGWGSLRTYLQDNRTFGDCTLIALRMRASNNLSMQNSRKVNVIATRKLPLWNGSVWSAPTATRSISWALAYACKQVGLYDAQIDLATLLALDSTWNARGDYFDARFDNFLSFWEAASKIGGAGRAKPYMQGGVMRVYRDQAATVPVALFSMRNIVKGSFNIDYIMPTEDTADAIDVGYFDAANWSPRRVRAALPGSTSARPAKVELFGVTGRDQAYREGMYQAADNRYRRKNIKFSTEMEGFIPSFGDLVAIQHDMPAWGQGGEVTAWNGTTRTATLSEPPTWGSGAHYIALRKRDGSVDGPYAVTAGVTANDVVLATSPAITPYVGGAEERTHYTFGWAETYRQPARVIAVRPLSLNSVEIQAVNEDASVHTADSGVVAPAAQTSQLASYTNNPVVAGLSAHPAPFSPRTLLIAWEPAAWAKSYLVELSRDELTWTRCGDVTSCSLMTHSLYGASTKVRVAAIWLSRGPWSQVDVTPSDIPQDVAQLTIDGVKLSWPAVSDQDISGYRIKYQYGVNTEWGTANLLYNGLVSSSPYVMKVAPPGSVTIMVRAVDSEGQESANSAYVITDLGDPLVANVIESYDFKALAWPGVVVNGSIVGGNLQSTQGDVFYKIDSADFYPLNGAPFYPGNYDAMEWVSSEWIPSPASAGINMTAAWLLAGDSVNVQYRPTGPNKMYGQDLDYYYGEDTAPFYSAAGDWLTWPGNILAEYQGYQWRVTTALGSISGLLSSFAISIDVPDKNLKLNAVAISAAGTRLTGAIGNFYSIENIQLTLQGGSTAVILEIQDKSTTLGPLITAKNSAGTGVTATIDAHLQGY